MLQGIAQSSGFPMWRMMMSEVDKGHIADLVGRLRRDGESGAEIAATYGVA